MLAILFHDGQPDDGRANCGRGAAEPSGVGNLKYADFKNFI